MTTASSRATPAGPVESLLTRARKRIEAPERWTQGHEALDANRRSVGPTTAAACQWCATGSLLCESESWSAYEKAWWQLNGALDDDDSVIMFNDTHTHAEVIAAFDRAISLAKDRGL
jgi:hypothetical protein